MKTEKKVGHTPGPRTCWTCERGAEHEPKDCVNGFGIIHGSPEDGSRTVWHSGEALALCKAAPDLLGLFLKLRDRLDRAKRDKFDGIQITHGSPEDIALRAAIARAEGGK